MGVDKKQLAVKMQKCMSSRRQSNGCEPNSFSFRLLDAVAYS